MSPKRTKIVATLGPATEKVETIRALVQNGANVFRLNFSHGTHENHAMIIANIRTVAKELNEPIAIMQDLQGPKIRLGKLPDAGIEISDGQTMILDTSLTEYQSDIFPVDFTELHTFVKAGDRLLINDGRVETTVASVSGTQITVSVTHGGLLQSHKGINVPDSHLTVSSLTDKDRRDAEFGFAQGVDYMALSFVKTAADVIELRELITAEEKKSAQSSVTPIKIITKIERPEAVENIAEILAVADGIMVARGDLGIEIPAASVPIVQKNLINAALAVAKPVIVATQMLDSMQTSPRPTRAEVSDVANAVIDHADAVMLSNETATGSFPVETVKAMHDIIIEAEASVYDVLPYVKHEHSQMNLTEAMGELMNVLSSEVEAKAIITASFDGYIAAHISHYRPQVPIVTAVNDERLCRQLALVSGVLPFLFSGTDAPGCVEAALRFSTEHKIAVPGDKVIVALSEPFDAGQTISLVEVKSVV